MKLPHHVTTLSAESPWVLTLVLDAPLGVETGTFVGYGPSSTLYKLLSLLHFSRTIAIQTHGLNLLLSVQPSLNMPLCCAAASLEAAYDVVHSSLQN